jgi:cytoskeletal protein RodZ
MLVGLMLSFELSVFDIVLLVAVIALFVLFITQQRGRTITESESVQEVEQSSEKPEATVQIKSEEHLRARSSGGFKKCIHSFGYLRNLPQNTPVPDECFGCPQVMRCLFPNEPDQYART